MLQHEREVKAAAAQAKLTTDREAADAAARFKVEQDDRVAKAHRLKVLHKAEEERRKAELAAEEVKAKKMAELREKKQAAAAAAMKMGSPVAHIKNSRAEKLRLEHEAQVQCIEILPS
jgi:hypothetical protein